MSRMLMNIASSVENRNMILCHYNCMDPTAGVDRVTADVITTHVAFATPCGNDFETSSEGNDLETSSEGNYFETSSEGNYFETLQKEITLKLFRRT